MRLERSRLPAAAVIAACAAALLFYGLNLTSRPLWLDESWSRWMAEQDWRSLNDSVQRFDTHPPFYYALLKLWVELVPPTPLGMRALSIAAALATLPLAWLCARRIPALAGTRWAAPLAVALVALAPVLVVAARQARPYALFALAFGLALWAALSLLDLAQQKRRRWAWWGAYLIGLELVLWLHSLGAVFAAALAAGLFLAFASAGRLRDEILPFLAIHFGAALAWLPGLLILLEQRRGWADTWLRFDWSEVPRGLASGLAAPGVAGWLVLALGAAGAFRLLRDQPNRPTGFLLIAAAMLPAAATIALSAASVPVFLPRTLIPSALPTLLLATVNLARFETAALRTAAAGALLLLLGFTSAALIARPAEEQWTRLAGWLDSRVQPREEVWLLPNELVLPLSYGRTQAPRYAVRGIPADFPAPDHVGPRFSGTAAVPAMSGRDAVRLVADARRRRLAGVWIVHRFPWLFDPNSELRRAFGHGPAQQSTDFAPLLIEYYRLEPVVTQPLG